MPEALRCPGCGNVLQEDAPEGLCPGCLFVQAMQWGPGYEVGPSTTAPQSPGDPFVPQSPGDLFAPPRPEDLAPHFPQLEILELLGQGGMGVVYKARQVRLDRFVALKVLPPERGRDPAFAERFAREARALARLSHPRIVGVHDFGEGGGLFYLLMEFVDGANLRHRLRRGRLTPDEAMRIVPQVCEALQYAHEEGVVHRDIKPENILLDRRGNVKIADFGLAKLLGMLSADSMLTGSRQVIGTLRYMAPEQMDTPLAVDHRADIYSLGVVFYEMLTGELPVGRFDPPSKRAGVDARLDEVVLRALDREPDRRYQNASDVKAEVESLAFPPVRSATATGPSPDEAASRPAMSRVEAWLLLPIICVGVTVGVVRLFIATLLPEEVAIPANPSSGPPGWTPAPASLPSTSVGLGPLELVAITLVLAAGVGLWGIWRFARKGQAAESNRRDRAAKPSVGLTRPRRVEGRRITAVEEWRPWPWVALVVGLYVACLFVETASTDGNGYRHMFGPVEILPNWLTSFSLLFGSWALLTRRELAAGVAGLIGTGSVLYAASAARIASPFHFPGYQMCSASMVLLAVGGFYGWWRTRREARARDIFTRPRRVEGRRITAVEEWRPWPWVALVVGLYVACLFVETASTDGNNIYRLSGYMHMFGPVEILPNWLTSFSLLFGSWALLTRRELAAGVAGLIGTGSVLYAARAARIASVFGLPGYQMCSASMVLLAVGGFYGWWRTRREARARDIRTTFAAIDLPGSDSDPSSGSPRTGPA